MGEAGRNECFKTVDQHFIGLVSHVNKPCASPLCLIYVVLSSPISPARWYIHLMDFPLFSKWELSHPLTLPATNKGAVPLLHFDTDGRATCFMRGHGVFRIGSPIDCRVRAII